MAPTIRAVGLKLYLVAGVVTGIAAYLLGAAPAWSLTIGMLAPAILAAAPRFLHGTIAGLSTRDDVATEMSGTEFEDYVARIARSSGLPVIMTSITGDWGVDIIVGKRPNRLAIQCKRQARPVGAGAVQEVVAGAPMQDCTQDHGGHQPRIHACRTQTRGAARLRACRRRRAATAAVDDPPADGAF